MSGLNDIGRQLADAIKQMGRDEIKKTTLDCHGRVVLRTPVDTGNARSSWTVDISLPDQGSVDSDCDYMEALNSGHSGQAPANFIEDEIFKSANRPTD